MEDKRVACSWVELDLCSNPDCKKYAPPAKVQASLMMAGTKADFTRHAFVRLVTQRRARNANSARDTPVHSRIVTDA
jgi:hypothetical protein